jgi:Lrp/AsnC family transcriptional regulator, leucine-responsive regulatory protein
MSFQTERPLDDTDWQVLKELQADARLSYHELGRRVGLSAPAAAERVRRLEDAGIIAGYAARVDAPRAGLPVAAFIQMRCRLDRCLLKTSQADDYPEVVEIHKLSGDYCSMLKVRAASIEHLEGVIERIGKHGEMRTSVVLSTQYADRPVEPPPSEFLRATASSGWSRPASGYTAANRSGARAARGRRDPSAAAQQSS